MDYGEFLVENIKLLYGLTFLFLSVCIILFILVQSNLFFVETVSGEEIYNEHQNALSEHDSYKYSAKINRDGKTQTTSFSTDTNSSFEHTTLYSGNEIYVFSIGGTEYVKNVTGSSETYDKRTANGKHTERYGERYLRQVLYDVQVQETVKTESETTYRIESSNRIDGVSGEIVSNSTTNVIESATIVVNDSYTISFTLSYDSNHNQPEWYEENY